MNLFQVAMISAVLLFVALSTALYAWLSRRHLMRLLQNEIVSASAAKRAKGVFLANVSHELRTPITTIVGYSDILLGWSRRDSLPKKYERSLTTIISTTEYLLGLVDQLIECEKSKRPPKEERVLVREIEFDKFLRKFASSVRPAVVEKGLQFKVACESFFPKTLHSDARYLGDILRCLVDNAIKFSDRGTITIKIIDRGKTTQQRELSIVVSDSGIGIDSSDLETIFQPFRQLDDGAFRKRGGMGLGLPVVQRYCDQLDIGLSVNSTPGEGSEFCLDFKAAATQDWIPVTSDYLTIVKAEAPQEDDFRALSNKRILLAEDSLENRMLIVWLLSDVGIRVEIAEDGRGAIKSVVEAESSPDPFDLVLMDMQMPHIDGYNATRHLRSRGFRKPIVALTANALNGDREKCLNSGCSGFIAKPVRRAALLTDLERYLNA